jgi:hypothetical protein
LREKSLLFETEEVHTKIESGDPRELLPGVAINQDVPAEQDNLDH